MFDSLLLKSTVKNYEMIPDQVLMIRYEKQDQQLHIQICKFLVV